jgi:hypothetical protein
MAKKKTDEKDLADLLYPTEGQAISDSILDIPSDSIRWQTELFDFTVSTLCDYFKKRNIHVPQYQRRDVWTDVHATQYGHSDGLMTGPISSRRIVTNVATSCVL